ncbi:GMP synthase (glutamine-hydrolysing) [Syntrophus gentianae]|uniref:GMP synthase (Glutamine-hydrolysing) n=1 Tax=Syntrophus gentianae TaxID=43775 RepID=A0A1H7YXN2_9BACT|nr:glutamine amidotransferase [Syntrophus gentianae]SEM49929.1 GMP synthase (glutamine-hydrolysing) [Syntrophus gentianae]
MSRIFLLKTGSSFPGTVRQWGDFESWTIKGLDLSADEVQVLDLPNGDPLPEVEACRGVVVTGSHAMVTDRLPWSMALEAWVPALIEAGIPFLGICYGHQLLAQAQGGTVGFHPGGKEIGTVDIHLLPVSSTDPLFCGLPSPFSAHTTHSQSVLSLPPDAIRLASNSFEPNHAFRIGPCAWGIQFHPEYDTKIMESYVMEQAKELEESRRDIQEVLRTIRDTPVAAAILRRFAFIASKGSV